jgi:type I restriction enzyme, R subunit
MTPEQRARQQIDLLLQQCGWIVQSRSETNLAAGPGVAIREALLKTGEADYLLFAGGKAIATVEAKPEGYTLTGVEGQSGKYATGLLDIYPRRSDPLAFCYESTGSETRFSNWVDPNYFSRGVSAFHRSETKPGSGRSSPTLERGRSKQRLLRPSAMPMLFRGRTNAEL